MQPPNEFRNWAEPIDPAPAQVHPAYNFHQDECQRWEEQCPDEDEQGL